MDEAELGRRIAVYLQQEGVLTADDRALAAEVAATTDLADGEPVAV